MIRCDEPMRRSKERASRHAYKQYGIPNWRCDKNCERCICGMTINLKGEWEHNNTENQYIRDWRERNA